MSNRATQAKPTIGSTSNGLLEALLVILCGFPQHAAEQILLLGVPDSITTQWF
jgi:hypothetical protein